MTTKTNILILLALLGIASFATGDNKACAQSTIAPQTCDAAVWKTMDARARMETEREIMQNQNLIYKADSVLSYTCFDSLVAHASKNVGILFTHTTYFDGKEIISSTGDDSMDNALQKSVIDVMLEYIPKNFNHSYLGGRGQYVGAWELFRSQKHRKPRRVLFLRCHEQGMGGGEMHELHACGRIRRNRRLLSVCRPEEWEQHDDCRI